MNPHQSHASAMLTVLQRETLIALDKLYGPMLTPEQERELPVLIDMGYVDAQRLWVTEAGRAAVLKRPVSRDILLLCIEAIDTCPVGDADPHTRVEARDAIAKGLDTFSDAELYDLVQRFGDREVGCEVHPFMNTLCDLKRFYARPGGES